MEPKVVRLFDVDVESTFQGPVFTLESPDLDCNFLRFDSGEGVPLHINAQVDVAGVVMDGEGFLQVDGQQHFLTEGRRAICLSQLPCSTSLPRARGINTRRRPLAHHERLHALLSEPGAHPHHHHSFADRLCCTGHHRPGVDWPVGRAEQGIWQVPRYGRSSRV
jgi:hypothetical protein